jgi:hypothetical protein
MNMEQIANIITVAIIFTVIYGVLKMLIQRKERLIMVEKGTSMPEIKSGIMTFSTIKYGIFFIGIGLGVLMANILTVSTALDSEVAYFSMIFLFGGVSLIIAHLVEKKKDQK